MTKWKVTLWRRDESGMEYTEEIDLTFMRFDGPLEAINHALDAYGGSEEDCIVGIEEVRKIRL